MDRYCEFCVNLRSVVYCKADAAYLCLSCDTKVHSANPLSNRHYRNLICESCRRRPSYVRCYDHQKFMCRGCDLSQHNASSKHRKRVVRSYVGCPSARDLGVLWDFDLNPFVDCSSRILDQKFGLESNEYIKAIDGGIQGFSVLEQLVDLLKVQTSNIDHISSIMQCQEHEMDVDQFSQPFLVKGEHSNDHNISLDPCSSPFTQLDSLESSETNETTLQGDSIWQCKSSVSSSQLWSQNMQDLGVCEEPSCLDDLNIPDIDLSFRNFEELFRSEKEPTSVDQNKSMAYLNLTESSPKKARYTSQIMSFSFSRSSAESSDTTCIDSGISPCGSTEHHVHEKSKGKKIVQLKDSEQDKCGYRKARSDTRKRSKSQSWTLESHESTTRSY
ncbi:hypothetical protein Lser_V15G37150 [Lactuca serriola]